MNWEYDEKGGGAPVQDPLSGFRLSRLMPDPNREADDWWIAVINLEKISIDDFAARVNEMFKQTSLLVPIDYDEEERAEVVDEQSVVIFARVPVLLALNVFQNEFGVNGMLLGTAVARSQLTFELEDSKPLEIINVPEKSVVMAVIDDGMAVGHNLFRDGLESTRVHMAYVMHSMGGGHPHTRGRCVEKAEIDAALAAHTHNGLLDEESFYLELGIIDHSDDLFSPAALRRSHGTHVMSMAAGYDMDTAPDTRPIICAMLPPLVTQDTTGQDLRPSLALAFRVLVRHARRFRLPDGSHAPVVFNFSYGNFAGSHDGTGAITRLIERAMARFPKQEKRILLPAGNGNLSRTHARVAFDKDNPDEITLRMMAQPDDRTASFVQMWMPWSANSPPPNHVRVRVTAPDGQTSTPIDATSIQPAVLNDDNGNPIAELTYTFQPLPTQRGLITLGLNPTASLTAGAALAPSGEWLIQIERVDLQPDEAVEVWIRRDDTLPGFPPHGRQAYFNNACYQRFDALGAPLAVDPPGSDCPVRRAGTLNGFADGASPMVLGAFVDQSGRMSGYSAAGPITPTRGNAVANRDGPDAAARADDSLVRLGLIGAGSHSGSMLRQGGTSTSTPLAARYVADGLAGGAPGDRAWLSAEAAASDPSFPGPAPIPTRGGGGRLDVTFRFEPADPSV